MTMAKKARRNPWVVKVGLVNRELVNLLKSEVTGDWSRTVRAALLILCLRSWPLWTAAAIEHLWR